MFEEYILACIALYIFRFSDMMRRGLHTSVRRLQTAKIWADFSKRSESLAIPSVSTKKYILNGASQQGPPSLKRRFNRTKYSPPELIDDMFKLSYEFMEARASEAYKQIDEETDSDKLMQLHVQAELYNPEVQYNFQYNDKLENNVQVIDYKVPVYLSLIHI